MSQKMKSIFVVILVATVPVAVVFISVFIGWLLEQNHGVERKYEIETVSATELMSHYMRDAYSADQKYTDLAKAHFYGFIVTGKIKKIEIRKTNYLNQYEYTITLFGTTKLDQSTEVRCLFHRSEAYSLRNLEIGDFVKIHGQVADSSRGGLRGEIPDLDGKPYFYYVLMVGCSLTYD